MTSRSCSPIDHLMWLLSPSVAALSVSFLVADRETFSRGGEMLTSLDVLTHNVGIHVFSEYDESPPDTTTAHPDPPESPS